ncbi:sulfate ABC transporter permease subunit CysT [Pectinatus sottacetonis]|uniref:sulfate ABC transporter permease subunit CysT n=1 Tax=Pectinatus sottacetonis TaxID=1002795 RepID=UPI0018C75A30|nr:sulfate ABC transporter permease subunit CysT [Pectinatus sottacetonis]
MSVNNNHITIIPGYNLSIGITIFYISFIILLPLISMSITTSHMTLTQFTAVIFDKRVLASFQISIICSLTAAVINCFFGTILACILVYYKFPGRTIIDSMIELPFAIPTAVAGISLAALYSPNGYIGKIAATWGLYPAYSKAGITIALIFVTIPFVVRTIEPVLQNIDPAFKEAAFTLGAGQFTVIRKIIFPEIFPTLLLSGGLAFARAMGEYGNVIFIAGNMPYKTEIVPLLIMIKLEQFNYPQATSIAIVMLLLSFIVMFILNSLQIYYQKIITGGKN